MYDLIIIGGGPAGLTAGIYAKRAKLNTLLIEKTGLGGQIAATDVIENYPSYTEINGAELMQKFEEHVKKFQLEIKNAEVIEVLDADREKIVKTSEGDFKSKAVIIASGSKPKTLNVTGEQEFIGKGVSFCATCDGPFFKGKEVIVMGGGDSAVTEALYLTKFASKVYLVHRRAELRAVKILQDKAFAEPKIQFLWNTVIQEIIGNEKVEKVVLKNVKTNELSDLRVDGVFISIGNEPNTNFINVEKDDSGFILTNNETLETNIKGIFAAGDCRAKILRQVSTAVGDGALAAFSAEKYLESL